MHKSLSNFWFFGQTSGVFFYLQSFVHWFRISKVETILLGLLQSINTKTPKLKKKTPAQNHTNKETPNMFSSLHSLSSTLCMRGRPHGLENAGIPHERKARMEKNIFVQHPRINEARRKELLPVNAAQSPPPSLCICRIWHCWIALKYGHSQEDT